eukprot:Nitzschia sp. Nitz4//scaffold389_size11954//3153//4203//NITZ4_009009-RA/size11954-augustus-gene-0.12-mRNA-1//-1//CDS//3329549990//4657//frame0
MMIEDNRSSTSLFVLVGDGKHHVVVVAMVMAGVDESKWLTSRVAPPSVQSKIGPPHPHVRTEPTDRDLSQTHTAALLLLLLYSTRTILDSFLACTMTEETHELQNEWILWEHKVGDTNDPSKWKENMKQLCCVNTVEAFWSYFNHVPRPSEVFYDGDSRKKIGPDSITVEGYSLFKKGIEPEWEDPQNVIGGEWFCRQYFEPATLDQYWMNLVVGAVSESIEDLVDEDKTYADCINGVRVVDKSRNFPSYRLEVWINTRDSKVTERLRKQLLDTLMDDKDPNKVQPKFDWKDHS